MHVGAKLSAEGFSNVHDALCELNQLQAKLAELMPEVSKKIKSATDRIRDEFEEAYAEDHRIFDERWGHYDAWGDANGIKATSWSIYEVPDLNAPAPILAEGLPRTIVYRDHWGDAPIQVELGKDVTTWGDLWKVADAMVMKSGDTHHSFVEAFNIGTYNDQPCWNLITGS